MLKIYTLVGFLLVASLAYMNHQGIVLGAGGNEARGSAGGVYGTHGFYHK
ncbi:MAG: hypothetical protein HQM15_11380 [Deltaproteobacteria bacterium]|nr:hypothetical protein [Deltaproteobacteria bacterium]